MFKNTKFIISIFSLLVMLVSVVSLASTAKATSDTNLCHQVGNGDYRNITVDSEATSLNGHDGHSGDIIPPISSLDYPGLNWDTTGQAIWNNGCVVPPPVDLCTNLADNQTTIPVNYEDPNEDGICTLIPVDVCPNIEEDQTEIPEGLIKDESGNCVEPEEETDICPDIEGTQTELPSDYIKNAAGLCIKRTHGGGSSTTETPKMILGATTEMPVGGGNGSEALVSLLFALATLTVFAIKNDAQKILVSKLANI